MLYARAVAEGARDPQHVLGQHRRPAPQGGVGRADVRGSLDPGARHRPHRLPALPRRQPVRLERQPGDRARLARPDRGDRRSRRRRRRRRPAPHPHGRGRRVEPIRPGTDAFLLAAIATPSSPTGWSTSARRRSRRRARRGALGPDPVHPRAVGRVTGIAAATSATGPSPGRRPERRRVRPHRHDDPGVRHGRQLVGRRASTSSPATSTDPAGPCSRRPPPAQPTPAGRPGRAGAIRIRRRHTRVQRPPESLGELPVAALAEEIDTPGRRPDQGAGDHRRQPGAVDAQRRSARRRARLARVHGLRRHLSSTRRPATPT